MHLLNIEYGQSALILRTERQAPILNLKHKMDTENIGQ